MDSRTGATGGLGQLLRWYSGPVGLLFGAGLLLAAVLALVDLVAASIVVALAVIGIVVPWKLMRQRNEYVAQIAALNAERQVMSTQLDEVVNGVNTRLDGALTKRTIRPIMQEFRKMDRDRINGLHAEIVQMQEQLAPPEDDDTGEVPEAVS